MNVCSSVSVHDVQIAVGTRIETPQNCYIAQIPGHTNYARSVRQPFPSNIGLHFSREMAVATIGPYQMLRSLCVIDTNVTILRHFLLTSYGVTKSSVTLYSPCIFSPLGPVIGTSLVLKCFNISELTYFLRKTCAGWWVSDDLSEGRGKLRK
jgi:hypothetical protein